MITRGEVGRAQALLVRITPFRMSKGIMALLSPIYLAVIPVFMTDANESFQRFITCSPLPLAYTMSNTTVIWL